MSFWPSEILVEDVQAPTEILQEAAEQLEAGALPLTVSIAREELDDRLVLVFRVKHRSTGPMVNLFEVSHRLDQPYPARIHPPDSGVPEFLVKERYVDDRPGKPVRDVLSAMTPRLVTNKWICSTPREFRAALTDLLSLDHMKARVLNLLALGGAGSDAGPDTSRSGGDAGESDESDNG